MGHNINDLFQIYNINYYRNQSPFLSYDIKMYQNVLDIPIFYLEQSSLLLYFFIIKNAY